MQTRAQALTWLICTGAVTLLSPYVPLYCGAEHSVALQLAAEDWQGNKPMQHRPVSMTADSFGMPDPALQRCLSISLKGNGLRLCCTERGGEDQTNRISSNAD